MKTLKSLIAIVLLVSAVAGCGQQDKINTLTSQEKKEGWILLFDGKTPEGWISSNGNPFPEEGWIIKDGILSLEEGQKGGDIKTVGEYSDFDLMIDFLYTPECNSGIKYFYTRYSKGGWLGMEYQLLDDVLAEDNKRTDHLCGALYDIFTPDSTVKNLTGPGSWNTARIVSKGKHVEHWLNGAKILEFERGSSEYLEAVAKSKYKSDPVFGMIEKGNILLQDHGHIISFRNIKIRVL